MRESSLVRANRPSAARPQVLVIGSSNTDLSINVERIPRSGETILGGEFFSTAGGKGANQAVAAARAGGAVTFIARVGQDVFGEKALAGFVEVGINARYVVRDPTKASGTALIFVGKNGDNCIAVSSGANGELSPADVHNARNAFRHARIVLLQLETPLKTVEAATKLAKFAGVPVILNPAPAQPLSSRLLRNVCLLTPNETETELLTGVRVINEATAAKAADKLRARGVQNVIITLGARGAFVAGKNVSCLIPGYKVKAVDTTGAGDAFNGTLAVTLAEGKSLLDAVRFACAAAAVSVTRFGAQVSLPVREEIEQMLSTGKVFRSFARRNLNGHANGSHTWAVVANQAVIKTGKTVVELRGQTAVSCKA